MEKWKAALFSYPSKMKDYLLIFITNHLHQFHLIKVWT